MSEAAETFWDGVHRRRNPARARRPHPFLVDALAQAPAGTALELGCGDGTSAVWLAARGWRVTGVDISPVALESAAAHAEEVGVAGRVQWVQADLGDWTTPEAYDLVAALFVHTPLELDTPALLARAAARVRRGGTLLVVGHRTLPPWAWDPDATAGLLGGAELAGALGVHAPDWRVQLADDVPREVDRGDGTTATVLDAIVHARRAG